jgi:hypothetical protein
MLYFNKEEIKMENYKRINDEEVFKVIEDLEKNETTSENVSKEVLVVKLKLLVDIRQFLRKIYKNMTKKPVKVFKQPTNNKTDIIVGK